MPLRQLPFFFILLYATRLILAGLRVADFDLFNAVGGVIVILWFLNSSMAATIQWFMQFHKAPAI